MPYPGRLNLESVMAEARALLEEAGQEGVTMRELARRLGVRAPSLYFHVESRSDVLRELIRLGLREFSEALKRTAAEEGTPQERIFAMARAYIAFAELNPQMFTLVFGPSPEELWVGEEEANEASAPLLALAGELAGEERALFAAESLWALTHGYTVLRLARQFRLNPDHEAGFEYGLQQVLQALAGPRGAG